MGEQRIPIQWDGRAEQWHADDVRTWGQPARQYVCRIYVPTELLGQEGLAVQWSATFGAVSQPGGTQRGDVIRAQNASAPYVDVNYRRGRATPCRIERGARDQWVLILL